jgi:hypothetical protein
MIIRRTAASVVLITQPDHAALAGRLMARWRADRFDRHPRRRSILHAIAEHDNGWAPIDASPIVDDDGRLLDFVTAPPEVRQRVWPRGVRHLAADPVAAALVAEHALAIYARYRGDPQWRSFFDEMSALRADFAGRAGLALELIARDYLFLRAGDLISLTFCNGWTEPQQAGPYVVTLEADVITIRPDPFADGSVPIEVAGHILPDRRFLSPADARAAFDAAPKTTIAGVARGT